MSFYSLFLKEVDVIHPEGNLKKYYLLLKTLSQSSEFCLDCKKKTIWIFLSPNLTFRIMKTDRMIALIRSDRMLEGAFMWFILFWSVFMVVFLGIGGFFMFRKFLKTLPKQDGQSDMDWEEYYVQKTKNLWTPEYEQLLDELVSPVPQLFRDVARHKIAGKIGELALKEKAKKLHLDLIIKGYIQATPKRDHKFLRKKLAELNIDVTPYEKYF